MRTLTVIAAVLLTACLTSNRGVRGDGPGDGEPLVLSKMGVMFVGGREIHMQTTGGRFGSGQQTQIVEQAPVHYLIPPEDKQEGKCPVVMVPGMGLTSYLYLATPDGRDGWAQIFAKAGHPVYVFDEPNNAISGFDVSPFDAVKQGQADASQVPRFMLWSNETPWRRWGIGPQRDTPFPDTRYPVQHIEQLYASITPVYQGGGTRGGASSATPTTEGVGRRGGRFRRGPAEPQAEQTPVARRGRGGGGRFGGGMKATALAQLLDRIGPAILIVHSASGETGFEATRLRPQLVTALVAVEVVGSPTDPGDVKKHFANKRFIGVFGDHFDVRPMVGRLEACQTTAQLINDLGGKANVIWLPKLGIKGNTHLLMQDNNNHEIAAMILQSLGD
jgi:pimeloyl-ACP methyl ester carboxylesterase